MINNYICPATFIGMTITSIVSHGPVALETGPVCYGGAEEGTASKAWVYSEQAPPPRDGLRWTTCALSASGHLMSHDRAR